MCFYHKLLYYHSTTEKSEPHPQPLQTYRILDQRGEGRIVIHRGVRLNSVKWWCQLQAQPHGINVWSPDDVLSGWKHYCKTVAMHCVTLAGHHTSLNCCSCSLHVINNAVPHSRRGISLIQTIWHRKKWRRDWIPVVECFVPKITENHLHHENLGSYLVNPRETLL